MSRRVSLNARFAQEADATDEVDVVLIRITHPAIDVPVRLSTDNRDHLSLEPLVYGTRSTWMAEDEPGGRAEYQFVLLDAALPGDEAETPHSAELIVELHDNDLAHVLRQTTTPARVDIAVVLASSPDLVEAEWLDLRLVGVDGDAGQAMLSIARTGFVAEPMPAGRFSKQRFPGLHP
jgi:hypothetical protein